MNVPTQNAGNGFSPFKLCGEICVCLCLIHIFDWFEAQNEPSIAAMHGPHSFSVLVTVRLYNVMPEVCRWFINEKQRKAAIRLIDQ